MTKVSAYRDENGTCSLVATGHAEGSNAVCAGVSAIIFALVGYLNNDEQAEILDDYLESGEASLTWKGGAAALAAFQMACIGILQIEMAEPEYVQTKISEKIFQIGA